MKTLFARGTGYDLLSKMVIFLAAFLPLASCQKEVNLPANYAKAVKLPGEPPAYPMGSVKGFTYPVSQEASLKIYNEDGASFSGSVNKDGTFLLENIPAGSYQLVIYYLVNRAENYYYTQYEAGVVRVTENEVSELGQINLPWTY